MTQWLLDYPESPQYKDPKKRSCQRGKLPMTVIGTVRPAMLDLVPWAETVKLEEEVSKAKKDTASRAVQRNMSSVAESAALTGWS